MEKSLTMLAGTCYMLTNKVRTGSSKSLERTSNSRLLRPENGRLVESPYVNAL
jgi:hypothetical protein